MPTVSSFCEMARQDLKRGEAAAAEVLVKHILRHYPKCVEAYRVLGETYAERGRAAEATRVFKLVLSADPEDFVARVGLGVGYRDQGGLHEAIFEFERAIELQPGNGELKKEIQRLRTLRDGPRAEAVRPTRATLGWIHLRAGEYERARREFGAVAAADVDRLDAWVGLLQALWRADRGAEAVEEGGKILELAPDCLKAQLVLADCYLKEGRGPEGRALVESARALDPDGALAASLFEGYAPGWWESLGPSQVPEMALGNVAERLPGVSSPTLTVTGSRGVGRARSD